MTLPPVTIVEAIGGDHHELRDGELFLGNGNEKDFAQLSYTTKRKGQVAYDANGEVLEGYIPIFVSTAEYARVHSVK